MFQPLGLGTLIQIPSRSPSRLNPPTTVCQVPVPSQRPGAGPAKSVEIASRARRLQLPVDRVKMLAESSVERVLEAAACERPEVIVIDSIQVMHVAGVDAAPGGVSQVRESAATLTCYAKTSGVVSRSQVLTELRSCPSGKNDLVARAHSAIPSLRAKRMVRK